MEYLSWKYPHLGLSFCCTLPSKLPWSSCMLKIRRGTGMLTMPFFYLLVMFPMTNYKGVRRRRKRRMVLVMMMMMIIFKKESMRIWIEPTIKGDSWPLVTLSVYPSMERHHHSQSNIESPNGWLGKWCGYGSKTYTPVVHIKGAGTLVFVPLEIVLTAIDPLLLLISRSLNPVFDITIVFH